MNTVQDMHVVPTNLATRIKLELRAYLWVMDI